MQNTATFRTATRGAIQIVILAAVAAIGVSVGRWAVPDGNTAVSERIVYISVVDPAAREDIIARKFAQMDAQDNRFGTAVAGAVAAPETSGAASLIERKLAQMEAEDARHGMAAAGAAGVPSVTGSESVIERKLTQMDALDSRVGTDGTSGGDIIERKFAQMDAEDAR